MSLYSLSLLLLVLVWSGGATTCRNKRPMCPGMAHSGQCQSNPIFMAFNCAKSCDTCHLFPRDGDGKGEFIAPEYVQQSSTKGAEIPEAAVDGNTDTASGTECSGQQQWFKYMFDDVYSVGRVKVVNGKLNRDRKRLNGVDVFVMADGVGEYQTRCGTIKVRGGSDIASQTYEVDCGGEGGIGVWLYHTFENCISIREIEVYAAPGGLKSQDGPLRPRKPTKTKEERLRFSDVGVKSTDFLPPGSLIVPSSVEQSSSIKGQPATLAVDGNLKTASGNKCGGGEYWFQYNFGSQQKIGRVVIVNGKLGKFKWRLDGAVVSVRVSEASIMRFGEITVREGNSVEKQTYEIGFGGFEGIGITITGNACLSLREVEVYTQE